MIYNKTNTLLSNIESYLLNDVENYNYDMKRNYFSPFKILVKGASIFIHDIKKFSPIFFMIIYLLYFKIETNEGFVILFQIVLAAMIFLFFFSSIFSVPSTISKYGVEERDIKIVKNEFFKLNPNELELDLISKNISTINEKFNQRVVFMRSILALLWAFNTFILTSDNIKSEYLFESYAIILMLFILVEFYKKGGEFIFKTIDFSLIDYRYEILDPKSKILNINYKVDEGFPI